MPSLAPPYPDVTAVIAAYGQDLPAGALNGAEWMLADAVSASRIRRMTVGTVPLGEYVKGQIYRGVLTGFNQAFVIDGARRAELIAADPSSAEIIKPFVVGKDIARWRPTYKDRWLIFTRRGIRIDDYPAIKQHLQQWRTDLTPKRPGVGRDKRGRKPGSYKWYEIQDDVAYYRSFGEPKIIFPDIALVPRFALDIMGAFLTNTAYFIVTGDPYLLGVLNSDAAFQIYATMSAQIRGGYLRFFRQYVEKFPVPAATTADRARLTELVQKCLDAEGQGPDVVAWEAEINARVARLYGLDTGE